MPDVARVYPRILTANGAVNGEAWGGKTCNRRPQSAADHPLKGRVSNTLCRFVVRGQHATGFYDPKASQGGPRLVEYVQLPKRGFGPVSIFASSPGPLV